MSKKEQLLKIAKIKAMAVCEFDRLFAKSVPHILEKIFFSLGYDSFKKCREVCKAWNELHSSESYQQKREELFDEEKKNNEQKLCQYSKEGNIEEVKNLLSSGVNPNCNNYGIMTPIHYAAAYGHEDVVKLLLNTGADCQDCQRLRFEWPLVKLQTFTKWLTLTSPIS